MPLIVKDRVRETTTTTGTGTLTLIAPVTGFQSFSVIGNGNTTYYSIVDVATGAWEVGIGTYTSSGTTLSRDIVLESSTGGAKISFSSGTKDVFCTYPAERSVSQADVGTDPNEIPLNQYLGSMAYQDRTAVNIGGGVATLGTATVTSIQNDTAISNVEPSLMLNFAAVEALDPRITYTRASTATYYNGVTTAVAEQNLNIYSQDFDTGGWNKVAVTLTANAIAAPDGTLTADQVIPTNVEARHYVGTPASVTGVGVYTLSIYAKAAGYSYVQLMWNTGSDYANFFLSGSGSVSQNSGGSPTITSVGDGWYRCSITSTLSNYSAILFLPLITGTELRFALTTGDGTSGIYIWGAQTEQRSAVSAYTPTTTQPITNYIPVLLTAASGVPRFDHNPISGDSLGFLVEQQSTNLVTYSSEFDNAAWTKTDSTITANTIVAPDGTLTGDKLVENTATAQHRVFEGVTVSAGAHTFTFYAKAAERNWVYVGFTAGSASYVFFDLINGVVGNIAASYTASISAVGNGWYRCSVTRTETAGLRYAEIGLASANNTFSYTGDGYSGVFIWGAQLEAGAFPTSYIATVASQVTRAADNVTMTGTNFSSWYNQAAGSLYTELNYSGNNSAGIAVEFYQTTSATNRWYVFGNNGGNRANFIMRPLGSVQVDMNDSGVSNPPNTMTKIVVAYAVNDFALSQNGRSPITDTSGYVTNDLNQLIIGTPPAGNVPLNGRIKKIAYYPRRLSNEELQEMTS